MNSGLVLPYLTFKEQCVFINNKIIVVINLRNYIICDPKKDFILPTTIRIFSVERSNGDSQYQLHNVIFVIEFHGYKLQGSKTHCGLLTCSFIFLMVFPTLTIRFQINRKLC